MYQSGYLTIEKKLEDTLILDYPNEEVRKSLIRMYLDTVYRVKNYITPGGGKANPGEGLRTAL